MSDLTKRLCRPGYDLQKEQAIQEAIIEIRELRAEVQTWKQQSESYWEKIETMEKQEPFDADSDVFRIAFEAALNAGNWPATRQGDGYRPPSTQIAWRIAFSAVNRMKLYLAPGAQPAPIIPEGWKLVPTAESRHPGIYKMLSALHAVDNTPGASEWASYAAFLAATPDQKE